MAKRKLTSEDLFARYQAFDEAAEHIALKYWTDEPLELEHSEFVAAKLRKLADNARGKAQRRLAEEQAKAARTK